ncbi:CapA family protein [Eubacterium limosum]|uniref:CapA family protein n=1 Tax=Eubacterium limosum TaxID=1736 RepID=UPI0010626366|nr:CapA family protein [Eubacterium limosum]
MRITFLGDITCDRNLLKAGYKNNKYNYKQVFSKVKNIFDKSELVIGNFETVCAGSKNNFQEQFMICNAPDEIVEAMKWAGITMVTTANNHCLDKGIKGLQRTIQCLIKYGIDYIGTNLDKNSRKHFSVKVVNGIKIAILSYTYSTNETSTGIILDENNDWYVHLLREQGKIYNESSKKIKIKQYLSKCMTAKRKRTLKRIFSRIKLRLGIPYMKPRNDQIMPGDTNNKYLDQVKKDIADAKEIADYTIVCPHFGGQFNTEPGEYSKFLMQFLRNEGVDAVIGNHPHVIQKYVCINEQILAYSIGSFNQSISSDYMVLESMPEYSILIHFYFEESTKILKKATFSILKIIENDDGMITVWPVNELYSQLNNSLDKKNLIMDIKNIYKRFTGNNTEMLREEYVIFSIGDKSVQSIF